MEAAEAKARRKPIDLRPALSERHRLLAQHLRVVLTGKLSPRQLSKSKIYIDLRDDFWLAAELQLC